MLRIQELSKRYKISKNLYFTALNSVSFEIENENMVAIIGESGSGKSTLMNLISTIDSPSGGYVEYSNKKVTFLKEKQKANHRKENVGFIFQSFNLLNDITILENVAVVMEIAGCNKAERYNRAKELLELVGLKDHLNKRPGYLSGGQKQRVAIARALANDPDLILADEPTGALDSSTSKEIMKLLATIANSGKKVLIVTHDMKVASYCERIIKMEDGNVVLDEKNEANQLEKINIPSPIKMSKSGLGMSGVFKLSSSAFKRRLRKNLILSLGTAVAIASLLVINIATTSINEYIEGLYGLYGNSQAIVVQSISMDALSNDGESNFEPEKDLEKILGIEDIEGVIKYEEIESYKISYYMVSIKDTELLPSVKVMYPSDYKTFGDKSFVSGKAPAKVNEVAISEDIAIKMGYNKDTILNETITLNIIDGGGMEAEMPPGMETGTEAGVETGTETVMGTGTETVMGITGTEAGTDFEEEIISEEVVVTAILSTEGLIGNSDTIYFTNDFALKYGVDENASYMRQFIIEVEDGYQNDVMEEINSKNSELTSENIAVFALRAVQELSFIQISLEVVFTIFTYVLGVSVIVAAIMIAVMSYVSILERMREVGVLRAIGARKRDIRRMFYFESISIGVIAGVLATIIGLSSGALLINFANKQQIFKDLGADLQLSVSPLTILTVLALSIVLALFSSFISINRGLNISPVEALKSK